MWPGPFSDLLRHGEMYSDTLWSVMEMEKSKQGGIWFGALASVQKFDQKGKKA